MIDRELPHNDEAERTVLGAILGHGRGVQEAREMLKATDFYRKSHACVWEAIEACDDSQQSVDAVTVGARMRSLGTLDEAGGLRTLSSLMDGVPMVNNVGDWCRLILDASSRREAIRQAQRLMEGAWDDSETLATTLDAHSASLSALSDGRGVRHEISQRDAIRGACARLDAYSSRGSGVSGAPSGMETLDDVLGGGQPGQLIVIGARPGCGKSSLLKQWVRCAAGAGWATRYYSCEMRPEATAERMLLSEAGVVRSRRISEADWGSINRAYGTLSELPITWDMRPSPTGQEIARSCRRQWHQEPLKLVVVDYLGRLSHSREQDWQGVRDNLRALKNLAQDCNLVVLLAAQLLRISEKERPNLSHFRGGGDIEAEADTLLALYPDPAIDRESAYLPTDLIVLKQREGPTPTLKWWFERRYTEFVDHPPKQEATETQVTLESAQ